MLADVLIMEVTHDIVFEVLSVVHSSNGPPSAFS